MNIENKEIQELKLTIATLTKQLDDQTKQLNAQAKQIEKLLAQVDELKRRLSLNSTNSSKPPTSDGLSKKNKNRSLRETDSEKFGGQVGHKGNTLNQTDTPDNTIEYIPEKCDACGDALSDIAVDNIIERQEVDIEVKKIITAHKAFVKVCRCGRKNTGTMPDRLKAPMQYGPHVRAMGTYLTNQFISKDRISNIFQDLFGLSISDTTLMAFDKELANKLKPFNDTVLEAIIKAILKHLDETGLRIAGKTHWVHVISTALLTYYRIDPKRGSMFKDIIGKIVHDHWKTYFTIKNVKHVLCNAHHLRELKALIEIDKEEWAQEMYDLLKDASRLVKPPPKKQEKISKKYDRILKMGFIYHNKLGKFKKGKRKKRPGHNLLIRLRDFKTETLRFLYDPDVPFTNNLAERDLRMIKLKQKVSGSFRTIDGAHAFAACRSFISTVQKQGFNVFESISAVFNNTFNSNSLRYV